jgi:phosphopantothenoylcysteine decarboxylase / phosphopantothenate---cysteine ligase
MKPPVVVLAITGSIAAYKAPLVARLLLKRGVRVIPLLSKSAREFIGAATLSGLTGEAVRESAFEEGIAGELHVELAKLADVIAIVPATADVLARLAAGRADDLITATVLCSKCRVLAAPAMFPAMWGHPATRRNVETLERDGRVGLIGPVEGEVASGDSGVGRMADPEAIAAAIMSALAPSDLVGRHIVVTAGPTIEDLDPVRFIGNRSTGKMGFAIAARAKARGARVTLVSGPVALATPPGVTRVDVRGALAMQSALREVLGADLALADALVMTAAVGDYRPKSPSDTKIKRDKEPLSLELVANPDLLADIGARRARALPLLVGFAVETQDEAGLIAAARKKLEEKRVDFVVANHAADSFGRDDNRALLVSATDVEVCGVLEKAALADRILDRVVKVFTAMSDAR